MVVAGSAVVFGFFAERYGGNSAPGRIDRHSMALIEMWEFDTGRTVIGLGDATSVVLLALVTAGLCLWTGRNRLAVLAVVGPGLTGGVTTVAKPLIGRTLDGDFAYPSGHAGGATALGLVLAMLVASLVGRGWVVSALIIVAGGALSGGVMGYVLSAQDAHYPTDSIGGSCVAVTAVVGSALVLDWLLDSRRRPAPPLAS